MRFFAVAVIPLVLMSLSVDNAAARVFNRVKRTWDMAVEMTDCALGDPALTAKIAGGYGCHCYATPPPSNYLTVDDIDKCCKETNECHKKAFENECSQFDAGPWEIVYRTKECKKNKQKCCELGQCEQTKTDIERCGRRICQCHYTFSQCAKKATIHDEFMNYEGNCIPLTP